jgi:multidrug efflux pump subunit AcrB
LPPLTRSFCSTDTATVGGESEDIEEGFQNLFLSIIVALALVHAILVIFFGSLLVPLIILLAAPSRPSGPSGLSS